jgi:hypothetical protein
MTRIANAEQVLLLLRAHLERAQRADKKRTRAREGKPGPLQRVQQLANAAGLSEADVTRALIAGLLTEEFGPEFAVEPRFQAMVEDVRQIIDRDEAGRALLKSAVAQLTR